MSVIKFIHTADLHLDSRLTAFSDSLKARTRRNELLICFCEIAVFAEENNVNGILIAGDLFESANVSVSVKKEVIAVFEKHKNIKFIILNGNHDSDSLSDFNKDELPTNVFVFGKKLCHTVVEGINIFGQEIDESFNAGALPTFAKNEVNILMLHGDLSKTDAAKSSSNINIGKLRDKNIDYLALGHYHTFREEIIDPRGVAVYCGTPEPRGFDERGDKGFVLIEIEQATVKYNFVPFSTRCFHDIVVDVSIAETNIELCEIIRRKLERVDAKDAVKITLMGNVSENNQIDVFTVQKEFENKFFFVKVQNKTKIRFELDTKGSELSLKNEFRKVVNGMKESDEIKNDILCMGFAALKGSEVDI